LDAGFGVREQENRAEAFFLRGEAILNDPIGVELLYTSRMDRVRFGRALGFGARQAVKTMMTAADAATAQNPSGKSTPATKASPVTGTTQARVSPVAARPASAVQAAKTVVQAREVQKGVKRGSRRFGESVWRPFVRLSGVLWLEVSGVFFGIFALLALGYLWKLREAWHAGAANAASRRSLMGAGVMLAVFGYFSVSSFVRARRRERQR
jgi:hypothetical protein